MITLEEQKELQATDLNIEKIKQFVINFRENNEKEINKYDNFEQFVIDKNLEKSLKLNLYVDENMELQISQNGKGNYIPLGKLNFAPTKVKFYKEFEMFLNRSIDDDRFLDYMLDTVISKFNNKKARLLKTFIADNNIQSLVNSNMYTLEEIGRTSLSRYFVDSYFNKKIESKCYGYLTPDDIASAMYNSSETRYYYHNVACVKDLNMFDKDEILSKYVADPRFIDSVIYFLKIHWKSIHDVFRYDFEKTNIELAKKMKEMKLYHPNEYDLVVTAILKRESFKTSWMWLM